jgi:hypothetical protein
VSSAIKNLCFEYTDDLKFHDPDSGQTIVILEERYFKELFVRAKELDFCCTHASRLSAKSCLVRLQKKTGDIEDLADWWKE